MKKRKENNTVCPQKYRFDPLDVGISTFLEEKGIKKDALVAYVLCDLADDCYKDTWAILTDDRLIITEGAGKDVWTAKKYAEYPLCDIKELKNEAFVSSGLLIGVFDCGPMTLCAYTNKCRQKMGHLAKIANKLIRKEEITESDYELENKERFCPKCGSPYPDPGRPLCPKCTGRMSMFLRVMSYAGKYAPSLVLIFIAMLGVAAVNLIAPYISGTVLFDDVLTEGGKYYDYGFTAVVGVVVAMVSVDVAKYLFSFLQGALGAKVSAQIVCDLKVELFTAMQKLSMRFFTSKQTGNLMTRVNNDALDIQYFLNEGMPFMIINLIQFIAMAIILFIMNPFLMLMTVLPLPLLMYMIKVVVPKLHKLRWRMFAKNSKMNSVLSDALSGMRVVKAFGKEDREISRFDRASNEAYLASRKSGLVSARTFPVISWIMNIGSILIWAFGGWQVFSGDGMTFGRMMTFVNYTVFIYGPLVHFVNCFNWWTNCMNSAHRMFEVIDQVPDVTECENPTVLSPMKGDIRLKHVTFEYEANKPVLHDIDLDIKAGQMIGLVGHSGAGKSTITNLITRLYDATEGSIEIDGVNIKDLSFESLHSQIGMVLQETFLFSGTVSENIAFAKPDASFEEIVQAASLAGAHDFIMRLPDGYDTVLARRGVNLSGGEQQRISIARAILIDPKILILDEATASVDTETEKQIQTALERLTKGRTTISIAHRLSTLRNADRIVVIDRGKIVEQGTPEELIKKDGEYAKMLSMQKEALKIRGLEEEEA